MYTGVSRGASEGSQEPGCSGSCCCEGCRMQPCCSTVRQWKWQIGTITIANTAAVLVATIIIIIILIITSTKSHHYCQHAAASWKSAQSCTLKVLRTLLVLWTLLAPEAANS